MAPTSQSRPNLEKFIPKSILNSVRRECPRPECRSRNVVMRYFNNNKHDQPRFLCNGCKRLFTFGGKLRESYRKAKNRTKKATASAKTSNLQAEGVETGESSGLASWVQMKTRSSRQGLSQTTNRAANATQIKTKSIEDIEDEEETKDSEEEIENETEDEDDDDYEGESEDEDEDESKDGESVPLDLNKSPVQESNSANEDEKTEQLAEETEEVADLNFLGGGNEDCSPANEVLESTEETPMVLDTNLREEIHPRMLLKTELLRMKAKKHLLDAQVRLEEVCIEKWATLMELEWKEIEQHRERGNRELYPSEEMLYTLKQQVVKVMSSWLVGPLNGATQEMRAAREASLEKVGQTVESLAREVDEMENKFVPHPEMVKIEKKAKRLWDRVVALTD